MQSTTEIILNENRNRNQRQVNPDGSKWKDLEDSTKAQKKRPDPILYENGDLLRLIIAKRGNSFVVGTTSPMAEFHQFGTLPYTIKPKSKQALAFGGKAPNSIARKKVNHPGLPKREILGINHGDNAKIIRRILETT